MAGLLTADIKTVGAHMFNHITVSHPGARQLQATPGQKAFQPKIGHHRGDNAAPAQAPSRMGVAGRYVLTAAIFDHIRAQEQGAGGEIQLTDAIAALTAQEAVYAFCYQGKRYDCGSKEGFLQATVELALQHPEVGADFREYIKNKSW